MYIKQEDHKKVMIEIYRVLKPGGYFMLWDVNIPKYSEGMKDIYVMPIEIELQNDLVKTSYGTSWKGREQDKSYFVKMAEDIGFKPEDKDEQDQVYYIKFKK
jgi:ubiquinone/menaquinone biosynthesis C-methylase UbiE